MKTCLFIGEMREEIFLKFTGLGNTQDLDGWG